MMCDIQTGVCEDLDSLKAFVGEHWQTPIVTDDEQPLVEAMSASHYGHFEQT